MGKDIATGLYDKAPLLDVSPTEMMDELKPATIFKVIDPTFRAQLTVLQQFCAGKKEHRCRYGTQCGNRRNGQCRYGGHYAEECVDGVWEALQNVDNVLRREIAAHKHSSKILNDLDVGST